MLEHTLRRRYREKFVKRFWETIPVYDTRPKGSTMRRFEVTVPKPEGGIKTGRGVKFPDGSVAMNRGDGDILTLNPYAAALLFKGAELKGDEAMRIEWIDEDVVS